MTFESLGLDEALLRAVTAAGYETPTDVQARAVPAALAGRDLRVCSSTGSGKTAAFVLPALMKVLEARKDPAQKPKRGEVRGPRILVLVPTRELAMQVAKAAADYGRFVPYLSVATIVGGVPYANQLRALRMPLDILIATPGRLIDHLGSGKAILENVEMLVLDEADRMLDMGFIDDIEHVAQALPVKRQTLMASATFAGEVGRLAQSLQRDDVERIEIAAHTAKHENITQQLMWADDLDHKHALLDHLLTEREVDQAVVFTSTQIDADRLAERLSEMGHSVAALHGGMPQGRRNRVLSALRSRQLRILVATDVAARGIDVPTITHVVNYGLPLKAEDYVHRIGRTGRAGREGRAITLGERRDVGMIRRIQQYTTQPIPVATVEGLEPRRAAPDLSGRPAFGGGDRRGPSRGGSYGRPNNYGGDRGGQGHWGDRPQGDRPAYGDRPYQVGPKPSRSFGGGNDRFAPAPRGERPYAPKTPFGERPQGYFNRDGGEQRSFGGERSYGGDRPQRDGHRAENGFGGGGHAPASRPSWGAKPRTGGEHAPFRGERAPHHHTDGAPSSSKPRFVSKGTSDGKRPRKAV
ncbi:DEAD/DEAH box helicase [Ideonella sp.]|jgi:superfamily II DNA/RNA helicase|uniref:DEAD/DEAH box helicase n=1 Tax=Ideonella sp. TaxID=1929293 RepID=UPI0037C16292